MIGTFISIEIISNQFTNTIGAYSVQVTKITLASIYGKIDDKIDDLSSLVSDNGVLDSVSESNLNFDKIKNRDEYISKIDLDWKEGRNTEFISDILSNRLSSHLKKIQKQIGDEFNRQIYSEIFITNQYGVTIGSTGRTSDYLQSDEEWYQNTLIEKDRAWIGKPEYDESSKSYSIDVGVKITDDAGNFLGVIKGVYDLKSVKDELNTLQHNIPYRNTPYLVDDNGYSILSTISENEPLPKNDLNLKEFGTNLSDLEPVKQALVKDSGFLMWSDNRFTTYSVVPESKYDEKLGWSLLQDLDRNEVFAPLTNLNNSIMVVGMLIVTLSAVVGIYFSRTISKPLELLQLATDDLSKGNLDHQITIQSNDELGKLAESFNMMIKDVKRKLDLEKELIKTQERNKEEKFSVIGELASRIAHDLRNPLSTIRNCCELLSQLKANQDEKSKKYISLMNRSINRMTSQIDDVLNYVRTTPLFKTKESCSDMIKFVIESNPSPENIKVILPKNDAIIFCDSQKIEVVFTNILRNAIQVLGNDQGTIKVNILEHAGFTMIEFEDSGLGISEQNLTRVFEPLFTTKQEGTGLGLSSCKNIVEQHGGRIEVKLNPTRFQVYLPSLVT
jgi:signal transduction histidine kinase